MSNLGQQKLLSYQYLPISEIVLHTEEELRHLKNKSILSDAVIQCNTKMLQLISGLLITIDGNKDKKDKNDKKDKKDKKQEQDKQKIDEQHQKVDFRKWAKQVDKICGNHAKLSEIQKIQLFNNAHMKIITSEPQLVLILSKLHSLPVKDRHLLLQKCTFE